MSSSAPPDSLFAPRLAPLRHRSWRAGGHARVAARPRLRRAPAIVALRTPLLAVWCGEVVLVAVDEPRVGSVVGRALGAAGGGRVRVAHVLPGGSTIAAARALVRAASDEVAVVAFVDASRCAPTAVEALRRAIARHVPCRRVCVGAVAVVGSVPPALLPGRARLLPVPGRL